jgi:RNA polymerase-binding transcription factor DksA
MATKKKAAKPAKKTSAPAKAVKNVKKAVPAAKKVAAKSVKKIAPAKPSKKVAPVAKKAAPKKAVSNGKKAVPVKPVKKTAPVKKAAATKKVDLKKNNSLKKTVETKKQTPASKAAAKKAVPKAATKKPAVKSAPAKKAVPASKQTAAKKVEPAKKTALKAAPAPAKKLPAGKQATPALKAEATPKPEVVKPAPKAKKGQPKTHITKTVTTFAKGALPNRPASASASVSMPSAPSKQATPVRGGEKKPVVVVAHRRLENKAKQKDESGKTMINYQPEFTRSILDEPEQAQGPVYRYSDEELNEFKELIVGRLESARKELVYLQGLITRKDEAGTEDTENRYMNMEDGSGAMEREQLAQLASRQIQFISHLEKAMIRIENKTYGICRVTGKLIDKARLRAVPHATLSIEAKKIISNK